jgi:predicted  nucleic acid-binding Zn-ribbon protein
MIVKCEHCGYEWDTESQMILVTCPSCGKKTKKTQKA